MSGLHSPRFLRFLGGLVLSFVTVLGLVPSESAWGQASAEIQKVKLPEAWKNPPAGRGGYVWYRSLVQVPAKWQGRELKFFLEPVDDAREVYLNGQKIGGAGGFPPQFRSGLGSVDRHGVDPQAVRWGEWNVVAIRVYAVDGRSGFNVAPPAIFAGLEAIVLAGTWQALPGDDAAWARWEDAPSAPSGDFTFTQVQPAADVEQTLRRLPGEEGPLSVAESLKRFDVSEDLVVEAVLTEPAIGQPLFLDFDERGRLWVMNYQQYPHPAGLTAISRDKFLRTVYDRLPQPPPHHFPGRDRITIHEDTNGDGVYDHHRTFVEGLSLASSFARGRGGVFVLNPPYLLFYSDRDQNDLPDGDPQVLLEGFGIEDSHSVASHLRWGPDGWLYGAQGSTVSGLIKRYGSNDKPVHSMGQLIWRYHPETGRYEVFAEGGGNTFGVEFDAKGRIFSGHNGGDTRGFHYVQGGYYQKGFGKHGDLSNPYTFGYFQHIQHHSVPRFTHTFVIYEGGALSARYAGRLFGVGPLQSHVVYSDMQRLGSTFQTKDLGLALSSRDPWFRPVEIKVGPDGAIYVCDFHEQRIDHASHYQGRVTPDTGRIYRLRAPDATAAKPFDYRTWTSTQLVDLLRHENKWHRQIALRLLADRRDRSVLPQLQSLLREGEGQTALEALWAISLIGGLDEPLALQALAHSDPYVRLWTVRLLADQGTVSAAVAERLQQLAAADTSVEVRGQLASSAQRLPASQALPVITALLHHPEDLSDPFQPLLIWWALEAHAESDREAIVGLFREPDLWQQRLVREQILERLMRRYAQAGGRKDLLTCAQLFQLAPQPEQSALLMKGFEVAFAGRTVAAIPEELSAALAKAGGGSLGLRLRRGEQAAVDETLRLVQDEKQPLAERVRYIEILGQINRRECLPVLTKLVTTASQPELRTAVLSAMQAYDDPAIAATVIQLYNQLPRETRTVAQSLLASRRGWIQQWLTAIEAKQIDPADVPDDLVQRMLFLDDAELAKRIRGIWGELAAADGEQLRAEVERIETIIAAAAGNPYTGRQLFRENCGKCHLLFGDGGEIGPNLTSYKRDDLRRMLLNIVHPSLEIREGFENFIIFTTDGRTLNGFVADQDNRVVVLKGADGQNVILSRDDIDEMQAIPRSIMPEKILQPLNPQQIRDLFAYLRATQPLP